MVHVPCRTPVTTPEELTVAVRTSEVSHVTFWLVAPGGRMVGTRVAVPPTLTKREDLFRVTPVTGMFAPVTVTEQVAVLLLPSVA